MTQPLSLFFSFTFERLVVPLLLVTGVCQPEQGGQTPAVATPKPQGNASQVTGTWTLCASETFVPAGKGGRNRLSGWVRTMANACTEVVFNADGTGSSGLEGGKKHAFTWQRHPGTVTVTYPGASVTRLSGGVYQANFKELPSEGGHPAFTQLLLSRNQEKLFLLASKRVD